MILNSEPVQLYLSEVAGAYVRCGYKGGPRGFCIVGVSDASVCLLLQDYVF